MIRYIVIALCAAILAACAPGSNVPTIDPALAEAEAHKQRITVVQDRIAAITRLGDVSFSILKANVDLCGEKVGLRSGFHLSIIDNESKDWHPAYREVINLGDIPQIISVDQGSPADLAGLQAGDLLIEINDSPVGRGKESLKRVGEVLNDTQLVVYRVLRNGESYDITVVPEEVCDYPVILILDNTVNAYADGKAVYISAGMVRFAEKDLELALVIGHEMAHNTRGHIEAKMTNRVLGAVVGAVLFGMTGVDMTNLGADIGTMAFSQQFEAEADYIGVYHAARAGHNVLEAAQLWRRMGEIHPAAIHLAGASHPSTAKRFLAIEAAAREIQEKIASNRPLIPEERNMEQN